MLTRAERLERLTHARLYLVCPPRERDWLEAVIDAGVDIVQLRDKQAGAEDLLLAAAAFREACDARGALFVLNDRPDLAAQAGADGVHVGQEDMPVSAARETAGEDLLVGLSTHSVKQVDLAHQAGPDYIAVGPIHETPTKPGRPAAGLAPVRHAAEQARMPWFAIGGIDAANVDEVTGAGARRIVVVRAIADAEDPAAAARELRTALQRSSKVRVGQT